MHGTADTTVPYTNSLGFAEALQSAGATCHTAWLPDIDHFDTVGTLFFEPDSASERQVGKFKKMIVAANDPKPRARL
jgi:alpha-beta hydrolase superfamily lysophospholipase